MTRTWALALCTSTSAIALAACFEDTASSGIGDVSGAPNASAGGSGSLGEAPTGQRWEAVETDRGCGREGIGYVLVDEVCGLGGAGYDGPRLQAPMFRDGVLVGDTLLTVDATFMWSLDVSTSSIERRALLGGLGEPVAAAPHGPAEVLLASGFEGLVRVDASTPASPARAGRVALPGYAHDVHVDGDVAYVALGKDGLGVVDLTTGTLTSRMPVPGYAVGVTTKGGHAYVAACTSLAVVDLATSTVVAQTWTPHATSGKVLVAPAKDVEIAGDVAFVAAGRHGAVAIDIATPTQPKVLGNCTRPEPSFYASGVRAEDGKLYVAGGEWGVLPIDVTAPAQACRTLSSQPPPDDGPGTSCTAEAPWEVLPWQQLWAPPPPAKDPIQVLPAGDRVFAFGDARRIGTRAVDVRAAGTSLPLVARYDEPRRLVGVAASGSRLVAIGPRGGLFRDEDGALVRTPSDDDATLRAATAVAFTTDGRWVAAANDKFFVEGRPTPLPVAYGDVHAIAPAGASSVVLASKTGLAIADVVAGTVRALPAPAWHLPLSIATAPDGAIWAAAPEWTKAVRLSAGAPQPVSLAPHGVFDDAAATDTMLWRMRLPRRHLVSTAAGLAEIAGLGPNVGLALHGAGGKHTIELPPATYAAAATDGTRVYALGIDRSLYRSTLVTVSVAGGAPEVVATEVFTGGGAGIAVSAGRAYVANADGEIRVYDLDGARPSLATIHSLEEIR